MSTGLIPGEDDCTHRVAIVSGFFNPLHVGHLRMMNAARAMADHLVVLVNNDEQQLMKKGRIIQSLEHRLEIVQALAVVDSAVGATDDDASVRASLRMLRDAAPNARLLFANGGDRSDRSAVTEADTCDELGIELVFGVGGEDKADASSRINDAMLDGASSVDADRQAGS